MIILQLGVVSVFVMPRTLYDSSHFCETGKLARQIMVNNSLIIFPVYWFWVTVCSLRWDNRYNCTLPTRTAIINTRQDKAVIHTQLSSAGTWLSDHHDRHSCILESRWWPESHTSNEINAHYLTWTWWGLSFFFIDLQHFDLAANATSSQVRVRFIQTHSVLNTFPALPTRT
jgi:hypothetical protein